jgi:hypothetical protein
MTTVMSSEVETPRSTVGTFTGFLDSASLHSE